MFTDGPVTPLRLETLLQVIHALRGKEKDPKTLHGLFQPHSISEGKVDAIKQTILAAKDLMLIDNALELTFDYEKSSSVRDIVLDAMDARVLGDDNVEPYFARFYSFVLGLNQVAYGMGDNPQWVEKFQKQVYPQGYSSEAFNTTKLSALHRWFSYVGLGFYDMDENFQALPMNRIKRSLPAIFGKKKKLSSEQFMDLLKEKCPELDNGEIFCKAHPGYQPNGQCTLGLSHALIDLHHFQHIVLSCPRDSRGWSIAAAEPAFDKNNILSERIESIEYLANGGGG